MNEIPRDAELEDFTCPCGAEFHVQDFIGKSTTCKCGRYYRREHDGNVYEMPRPDDPRSAPWSRNRQTDRYQTAKNWAHSYRRGE